MMSTNSEIETDSKATYIKGICYTMCPQYETKLRQEQNMVHVLEVYGSERKLVKSYFRSAADCNKAIPNSLRPFPVLRDTVKYLLREVTNRTDVPSNIVYDFVNDRLRAVRQDMIIQNLPPSECVKLLDPMVRFYVYYNYKLSNFSHDDYSPVLNKRYLQECLVSSLYNWCKMDKTHDVDELTKCTERLNIKDQNSDLPTDKILMEALYILTNLGQAHPLTRYLNSSHALKRNATLRWAYRVGLAGWKQNYMQIFRALDSVTCPVSYCALYTHLPELHRSTLNIMSHAYNSKRLTVPCDVLKKWLRLIDIDKVKEICSYYGLETIGDGVRFNKENFNSKEILHLLEPRKLNENLDLSWENILLYTSKDK